MNIYEDASTARQILESAEKDGLNASLIIDELKNLSIETPSWGYANTGTRFGKFLQAGAARTIEEKLSDAGIVHKMTGICPTVAVHVLWDFPKGYDEQVVTFAQKAGVNIGAINPNVFQEQCYKFGSLTNNNEQIRRKAIEHIIDSIKLAKDVNSNVISLWLADGTNYPGQDDISARRLRLIESLKEIHSNLSSEMAMLIEYKPFEPATYHTDIADWGMAMLLARHAGKQAKVLVDIGHHYLAQNIEQIVAWLIDEDMLGGFHFNDRRYADDDLTTASIDPYQMFRIFHEIISAKQLRGKAPKIAYMIDQSHNLKPKIEAMIQTVDTIHQIYAKALLVNRKELQDAQANNDIVKAEEILRDAYLTDTRPIIGYVREETGRQADAIEAYRNSGYQEKIEKERQADKEADASFA